MAPVLDRPRTDQSKQAARAAAAALAGAAHSTVFRIELGELLAFLTPECPRRAALFRLSLLDLIARKAVIDVGPPCSVVDSPAHGFSELAVIDDINASVGLPADNLGDRGFEPRQQRA